MQRACVRGGKVLGEQCYVLWYLRPSRRWPVGEGHDREVGITLIPVVYRTRSQLLAERTNRRAALLAFHPLC